MALNRGCEVVDILWSQKASKLSCKPYGMVGFITTFTVLWFEKLLWKKYLCLRFVSPSRFAVITLALPFLFEVANSTISQGNSSPSSTQRISPTRTWNFHTFSINFEVRKPKLAMFTSCDWISLTTLLCTTVTSFRFIILSACNSPTKFVYFGICNWKPKVRVELHMYLVSFVVLVTLFEHSYKNDEHKR